MEPQTLLPYVLRELAHQQLNGHQVTLQTIVDELRVRRADIRKTISSLHLQGYLDIMTLRLTMEGFTAGVGLLNKQLPPLRRVSSITEAA